MEKIIIKEQVYDYKKGRWTDEFMNVELTKSLVIEGHKVFLKQLGNWDEYLVYDETGKQITANWRFGRTGTKNHEKRLRVNSKGRVLQEHGFDGPAGIGRTARLININW